MQLIHIEIDKFGKWSDRVFEVESDLQVFLGQNEAGKSTLMNFIQQVLFGFPDGRSKRTEPYYDTDNQPELSGRLYFKTSSYGTVIVERKKTSKSPAVGRMTVKRENGEELSADVVTDELLKGLTLEDFRTLFTFSLSDLEKMEQYEQAELEASFQSLTIDGSQRILDTLDRLDKKGNSLYLPNGKRPLLNDLLARREKLRQELASAREQNEEYLVHSRQLQEVIRDQRRTDAAVKQTKKQQEDLLQQMKEVRLYQDVEKLQDEQKVLPNGFDESVYYGLKGSTEQLEKLKTAEERTETKLTKHKQLLAGTTAASYFDHQADWEVAEKLHEELLPLAENVKRKEERAKNLADQFQQQIQLQQLELADDIDQAIVPEPLRSEEDEMVRQIQQQLEALDQQIAEAIQREIAARQELEQQEARQEMLADDMLSPHAVTEIEEQLNRPAVSTMQKVSLVVAGLIGTAAAFFFFNLSTTFGVSVSLLLLFLVGLYFYWQKRPEDARNHLKDELVRHESRATKWEQAKFKKENLEKEMNNLREKRRYLQVDYQKELDRWSRFKEEHGWPRNIHLNQTEQYSDVFKQLQQWQYEQREALKTAKELDQTITRKLENLPDSVLNVLRSADESELPQLEQLAEKLSQMADYQKQYQHLRQEEERLKETLKTQSEEIVRVQTDIEKTLNRFGADNFDEWEQLYQDWKDDAETERQIKEKRAAIKTPLSQLPSQKELNFSLQEVQHEHSQAKSHQNELLSKKSQLEASIDLLSRDGTYDQKVQEVENLEAEIEEFLSEWAAIRVAMFILEKVMALNISGQFDVMNDQVDDYFSQLTGGRYSHVHWSTEEIKVTDRRGQSFDLRQLSRGTAEPLYLAIRLAFIDQIQSHFNFPIVIDDAFVNFDRERKGFVYSVLESYSKSHQVLYFTFDRDVLDYVADAQVTDLDAL